MRTVTPFWTSRSLASDLWREMDRMMDDFATSQSPVYDEREFTPATEIAETDSHYLLSIDLPGLKKDEIKIEVLENTLTVSGERKRENRSDQPKIHRAGTFYGAFKRSFVLPTLVHSEKIEARYEDGVLELYLPKAQAAQSRKIEIQSGKGGFFDKLLSSKKPAGEIKDVAGAG